MLSFTLKSRDFSLHSHSLTFLSHLGDSWTFSFQLDIPAGSSPSNNLSVPIGMAEPDQNTSELTAPSNTSQAGGKRSSEPSSAPDHLNKSPASPVSEKNHAENTRSTSPPSQTQARGITPIPAPSSAGMADWDRNGETHGRISTFSPGREGREREHARKGSAASFGTVLRSPVPPVGGLNKDSGGWVQMSEEYHGEAEHARRGRVSTFRTVLRSLATLAGTPRTSGGRDQNALARVSSHGTSYGGEENSVGNVRRGALSPITTTAVAGSATQTPIPSTPPRQPASARTPTPLSALRVPLPSSSPTI